MFGLREAETEQVSRREPLYIAPGERWNWQHGVMLFVGLQLISAGLPKALGLKKASSEYYENLRQPVFAPPGWVFPIVWTVNNILIVRAILAVLNKPAGTPGREKFLALQTASLFNYVAFGAAYFGLRSPVNAAALTLADLAINLESLRVAVSELRDTRVAGSFVTLIPWLLLAAPVSLAVMLWNRDKFWRIGPFAQPLHGWEKE